jgi:hypothetical protein
MVIGRVEAGREKINWNFCRCQQGWFGSTEYAAVLSNFNLHGGDGSNASRDSRIFAFFSRLEAMQPTP